MGSSVWLVLVVLLQVGGVIAAERPEITFDTALADFARHDWREVQRDAAWLVFKASDAQRTRLCVWSAAASAVEGDEQIPPDTFKGVLRNGPALGQRLTALLRVLKGDVDALYAPDCVFAADCNWLPMAAALDEFVKAEPRAATLAPFVLRLRSQLLCRPPFTMPATAVGLLKEVEQAPPAERKLLMDRLGQSAKSVGLRHAVFGVGGSLQTALAEGAVTPGLWLGLLSECLATAQARAEAARVFEQQGRADLALALTQTALRNPNSLRETRALALAQVRAGQLTEAVDALRRAERELPYPVRRLARLDLYQQLAGGIGRPPVPPPWLPQPPGFTLPPSPFNTERAAREAALAANPGDPELRLAVADLSSAFWPGSDAVRTYADLAQTATDPALRIAAWLAWAEAKPVDAWPINVDLHNPLLALPDEEGLRLLTLVGLATVADPRAGQLKDNVVRRLLPLWTASKMVDARWRAAVARAAALAGRPDEGLALLTPCALSPLAAVEALAAVTPPDTQDLCAMWLASATFGSSLAERPNPYRRAGWDVAMLHAAKAVEQAPVKDLPALWNAALSRAPQPDDPAAQAAREALRGALAARLKTAPRAEVEAVLARAAAPLTPANKAALSADVTALADALLPLLGAEPSLAAEQLSWELGKLGVTWQHAR